MFWFQTASLVDILRGEKVDGTNGDCWILKLRIVPVICYMTTNLNHEFGFSNKGNHTPIGRKESFLQCVVRTEKQKPKARAKHTQSTSNIDDGDDGDSTTQKDNPQPGE